MRWVRFLNECQYIVGTKRRTKASFVFLNVLARVILLRLTNLLYVQTYLFVSIIQIHTPTWKICQTTPLTSCFSFPQVVIELFYTLANNAVLGALLSLCYLNFYSHFTLYIHIICLPKLNCKLLEGKDKNSLTYIS